MRGKSLYPSHARTIIRAKPFGKNKLAILPLACGFVLGGMTSSLQAATQVKDINSGSVGSSPEEITVYNNKLYFVADDGINGAELWVSDGTNSGTSMLKDINSGIGDSNPYGFTVFNNLLYFGANDGVNGQELWVTNGTSGGTSLVTDINPGSGSSSPSSLKESDGKLYFQANDGMTGAELWVLDPAATCTFPLAETQTNVVLAGFDGRLTLSSGDQKGTYTVQSQLSANEEWAMIPAGVLQASNQVLDVSSGIIGLALNPDQVPESDGGNVASSLRFYDGTSIEVEVTIAHSDGTLSAAGYHIYVQADNGSWGNFLVSGSSTKPDQIGVYFNNQSGDPDQGYWGISIDGTDYGYQYAFTGVSSLVPALTVKESGGTNQQSISRQGAQFVSTFVTTATGITASMPTGATDHCGNPL